MNLLVNATSSRNADGRSSARLRADALTVGYSGIPVVSNVTLTIGAGEIVALLGRNGAGKTTLIHTMAGLIPPISGDLVIDGTAPPPGLHRRVRGGLRLVSEQRAIIKRLSVLDNLRLGRGLITDAFRRFPELESLGRRPAGLLSGGEQQMLALAKSLAARPKILLIDELSLGLAPLVVQRLLMGVRAAAEEDGTSVLLVEQQSVTALRIADRACVIAGGEIRLEGDAADLRAQRTEIERLYLTG